ncbi:type VII secretion protein EssB [Bacillus sp. FSL W7-1360]
MDEKKKRYLEEQTGAAVARTEDGHYTITLQYEEIKLHDVLEAQILDGCDAYTTRTISQNDDDFVITVRSNTPLTPFGTVRRKTESTRLFIAAALIQKVMQHRNDKLHLIICPENVLVSEALDIVLIHYGIKNSMPPDERDEEKLFLELRATLSALLDGQYHFNEYMNDNGVLKLSPKATSLMKQTTLEALRDLVSKWIQVHEKEEAALHKVPKKKWTIQKWTGIGLIVALVPAIVFTVYVLAFLQPRQAAFTESHRAYLNENYSEVIDILESYKPNVMPRVVKFQLAQAYVATEQLKDEQKANLTNVLVLQAAEPYFDYWIAIGRGENEEAVDIARGLGDEDLIAYAQIKHREEVKNDKKLSGKEREDLIKEIDNEITDYMQALEKLEEEKKQEEERLQPQTEPASSDVSEEEQNEEKDREGKKEDADEKKDGGDE